MTEPTTPQLTEREVEEIAVAWIGGKVSIEQIGALIRDWRALQVQRDVAIDLCNVATESLKKSETANAALREQLADAQAKIKELNNEIAKNSWQVDV